MKSARWSHILFISLILVACSGKQPPAESLLSSSGQRTIICWGDSLTAGNEDGSGVTYPDVLAQLSGDAVLNRGVGSQTSGQILARAKGERIQADISIIWIGRNNSDHPEQVLSDIESLVEMLPPPKHFLVLSVLNSYHAAIGRKEYSNIRSINNALEHKYGEHYLDVRSILLSQYDWRDPVDLIDDWLGIVPSSLRYDNVHLNARGYEIVGRSVFDRLRHLKYL